MYCSKCGAKLEEHANFCPYCGNAVKKVDEKNFPKEKDSRKEQHRRKESRKGTRTGIRFVLTVLVAAAVIILVLLFIFRFCAIRDEAVLTEDPVLNELLGEETFTEKYGNCFACVTSVEMTCFPDTSQADDDTEDPFLSITEPEYFPFEIREERTDASGNSYTYMGTGVEWESGGAIRHAFSGLCSASVMHLAVTTSNGDYIVVVIKGEDCSISEEDGKKGVKAGEGQRSFAYITVEKDGDILLSLNFTCFEDKKIVISSSELISGNEENDGQGEYYHRETLYDYLGDGKYLTLRKTMAKVREKWADTGLPESPESLSDENTYFLGMYDIEVPKQEITESVDLIFTLYSNVEPSGDGIETIDEAEESPTPESVSAAIESASEFAWNWFWDNTRDHVDEDDSIHIDMNGSDIELKRITYEGIHNLEDVATLTQQYFTEDVADELMAQKQWREYNGSVYVSEPEGIGGPAADYMEIYVEQITDQAYMIHVYEYMKGELWRMPYTVSYELVNGNWVFDDVILTFGLQSSINVLNEQPEMDEESDLLALVEFVRRSRDGALCVY